MSDMNSTLGNTSNSVFANTSATKVIKVLFNGKNTDFSFKFKDRNDVIPSHKMLLVAKSPVFNSMFNGDLKERGDVLITDATPEAFKEFLQFFYDDQVTLTMENIEQVLYCAEKYQLIDDVRICESFLKSNLTPGNLFWNLRMAVLYNLDDLEKACGVIISDRTQEIFDSPSFLNCNLHMLKSILKLDKFSCNEALVFDACMKWAKEQCQTDGVDGNEAINLRNQLEDCFDLIRFNEMSKDDFISRFISNRGMFSGKELEDIFTDLFVNNGESNRFKNHRESHSPTNEVIFRRDKYGNKDLSERECTRFSLNSDLILYKIEIAPVWSKDKNATISTTIQINLDGKTLISNIDFKNSNIKLNSTGTIISLPTQLVIKKACVYNIYIRTYNSNDFRTENFVVPQTVKSQEYELQYYNPGSYGDSGDGIVKCLYFQKLEK